MQPDADAAPQHARRPGVEGLGIRARRPPVRAQPFEAGGEPGARLEHLAGRRRVAHADRVDVAELERVDAAALGHHVHQHVVQQRRLRHPEAAEGAGRRLVGVDAGRGREHVGHVIGAGRVHRDPVLHREAERDIGAGVEVAVESVGGELPVLGAAIAAGRPGRVALGGGRHRLDPVEDRADRAVEVPRRDRQQHLERTVDLAAEAAAAGAGQHVDRVDGQAEHVGDLVPVHMRRLGGGRDLQPAAGAARPARLGLDIGVLDEGGLEAALDDDVGFGERRLGLALLHEAGPHHVVFRPGMDDRRVLGERALDPVRVRADLVADRHVLVADPVHRLVVADQGQHRLAAMLDLAVGEYRLVLDMRIAAETVDRRHVGRAEHPDQPGMGIQQGLQVADGEARAPMRRAHRAHPERIGRRAVRAEHLAAVDLAPAVGLGHPCPDRLAGAGVVELDAVGFDRVAHRRQDLLVAGAAAQHAAQRVLDRRVVGLGPPAQQVGGRHQHARGADPALRRAVQVERVLERRQPPARRRQPLDGQHLAPLDLGHRRHAGADLAAVQQHRAGAAIAGVAADLGPGQQELLAQHMGEPADRVGADLGRAAVEGEGNRRLRGHHALPSSASVRRVRVSAASIRYSPLPRTSSIGDRAARWSSVTASCRRPSTGRPRSSSRARRGAARPPSRTRRRGG